MLGSESALARVARQLVVIRQLRLASGLACGKG